MHLQAARVSGLALLGAVAGATAHSIDESQFKAADIISRDVAIIGGGAAGAYSDVRIRDSGKTVAVIEKSSHLVSSRRQSGTATAPVMTREREREAWLT